MLWTEKYRPYYLSEIVGQYGFIMDAENWVENKNMPNVLLYGVAGTGKTAASGALANETLGEYKQSNFIELNASDDRKLETVRTKIKEIASTSKIGDVPYKIILLDEMDGMTKDAQNALKRIMERYADNCRFILTCNDRSKVIYPLQSRCANYQFTRLSDENIKLILEKILEQENHKLPDNEDIEAFIGGLHGDIRRGITELQASIASNSPLSKVTKQSLEPYSEIIKMILENKYENALDKLHSRIYQVTDMNTVCINLHDAVLDTNMTQTKKFQLLKIIGEAEWRSRSTTPKLLCSWLIGKTM